MLSEDLAHIDLHTLQALVMVQDCQSFSQASQRLGVNQSTISYAINRLRKAFNDPIFVRQGNSIVATDKCSQLAQGARRIIEQMQALSTPSGFDPATADGSITVSCNHHERMFLIPNFVREAQRQAPNVKVNIYESAVSGKQQLKENICDIVVGPVAIFGDIYYRRNLFLGESPFAAQHGRRSQSDAQGWRRSRQGARGCRSEPSARHGEALLARTDAPDVRRDNLPDRA